MVVLGGEFILILFIGVKVAGCWSELRSGCFWEVNNVLTKIYVEIICWLLFGGVVKRGCTLYY